MNYYRLAASVLILLLAIVLQLFWGSVFDFKINFTLAALTATAFFFDFSEFLLVPLLAVFIMIWQPVVNLEILVLFALPLAVFLLRRINLRLWLINLAASPLIFLAFYLILDPRFLLAHAGIFLKDLLGGTIFSSAAIQLLDKI